MDFVESLRVLLRRWRVLLVGIIAIAAAAAGAIVAIPTNYQAAGQLVLLLPAQSTGAATPTNPYLNLEPGLTITASLIAATLSTKDAARSLETTGFTSEYSIGLNPGAGPILEISAEDNDPVMAVRTRDEVIKRLQEELARIQQAVNAPQRQLISARTNSMPNVAEALPGSKIRALAAIGGVGMVVTLLIAFMRDRTRRPMSVLPTVVAAGAAAPSRPAAATAAVMSPVLAASAVAPVAVPPPAVVEPVVAEPVAAEPRTNGRSKEDLQTTSVGSKPTVDWWDS